MYKVDLLLDKSTENAVETRRAAEAARKARIFNTRLRVMGLDTDALNRQIQEKKRQQDMEKQRDKAFDTLRKYQDASFVQQDINVKEKRKTEHQELTKYWASQQRVEDSRDADLKCGLKGAFQITIAEGDLGPASMQIFQGEGIGLDQTRREQMKRTEKDLRAQMDNNKRRHMGDKYREMLADRELVHQDLSWVHQAAFKEECKKAECVALNSYNQALAADRAANLQEQRRAEERENLAELWHTVTSDMLTENPEAAMRDVGGGNPPQILSDRWKGLSPEQLSAIHREREQQRLDRQRQLNAEKISNVAWDFRLLKMSREAEEEERRAAELRRQQRLELDRVNMLLAREQKANQEHLNRKLYTNKPTKDYFNLFNTSSR